MLLNSIRNTLKFLFFVSPAIGVRVAYKFFCWPGFGKIRNKELRVRDQGISSSLIVEEDKIRVLQWGNGNKKILLVHGWASNAGGLGGFVNPLSDLGYQVTAFDGPAHGESNGHFTNLIHFSKILSELLIQIKPDIVISHSFGSAATIFALSDNPDLRIEKLVMLTTPDALRDLISDFSLFMGISLKHQMKLISYISQQFNINVDQLKVHKLANKTNISSIMLIHDPEDRILPFSGAERVAKESGDMTFLPVNNKGHYRILWDKEIIQHVLNFINNS